MFKGIRRRLFTSQFVYTNPIDRQRMTGLLLMNWVIAVVIGIWLAVSVVMLLVGNQDILPVQTSIALTMTLVVNLMIYWQIQTGKLRWATHTFVTILVANAALLIIFPTQIESAIFIILLCVPLVAAGMLLNRGGMILTGAVLLVIVIYGSIVQDQTATAVISGELMIVTTISLGLILAFLFIFRGNVDAIASAALADVEQLEWTADLGVELGMLDSEQEVLSYALDAIRLQFEYLSTQVYLVDEAGSFSRTMRAGNSEIEVIRREGFSLGEANIIFEAYYRKTPSVTSSSDPLPRRSHLLPAATFGGAIPMRQGEQMLGVLDVQKAGQKPFTQREIHILSVIVDQIGIALLRSQAVGELGRNLREQQTANRHLQTQVSEYQQREKRSVIGTWRDYLEGQGKAAIGYNIDPDNRAIPIPANDLPQALYDTLQSGNLQIETEGEERIINVPISFRDQTLGAMSFAIPKDQELSERQIEMARVVAERLALALENTRLFEQSQAQALRERKASEISSLLIGATDVPSVLNLAAENFNEALGAIHTRIYIQPGLLIESMVETLENEEL